MNVGTVNCGVTPGGPTGAEGQAAGMIPAADKNMAACERPLHLPMASEA